MLSALVSRPGLADEWGWLPNFSGIIDNGTNELFASGYAWHDPMTYMSTERAHLNPFSLGSGYARILENPGGSTEMLSAQLFADSYWQPQVAVQYTRYRSFTVVENLSAGLGFTAGLSRREDTFHGLPEPILLPVGVITIANRIDIYATYIPPLSEFSNLRGDVAMIFAGVRF